jgi:flavin-dependent dehydrogenase
MNIAGKKVNAEMLDIFLNLPSVREALPDNLDSFLHDLYYFKGKFPTLPAKNAFGDRYVMIGDASGLIRPFKGKGINSAVITGIRAAENIIDHGISEETFQMYLKSCSELTDDIPYGKILRFLTIRSSRYGLLDSIFETAKKEKQLRRAFFNIVSGQETYKKTWQETRNFKLFSRTISRAILGKCFKGRTSPNLVLFLTIGLICL